MPGGVLARYGVDRMVTDLGLDAYAAFKDGTSIVTEVQAVPFTHRGEPHVLAIARDIFCAWRSRASSAARSASAARRSVS